MKKLLNVIGYILYAGMILWEVIEFLAVPAVLVILGLLNELPWQYYVISIGGYFALFIIIDVVLNLVFRALEKKYTPFIKRKIDKLFERFPKKD